MSPFTSAFCEKVQICLYCEPFDIQVVLSPWSGRPGQLLPLAVTGFAFPHHSRAASCGQAAALNIILTEFMRSHISPQALQFYCELICPVCSRIIIRCLSADHQGKPHRQRTGRNAKRGMDFIG